MAVRFSKQMIPNLIQPFWAAWQGGEFLTDAAALAGTSRHRGLAWLREAEWARTAEDVLWRRSKLGLRFSPDEAAALERWLR